MSKFNLHVHANQDHRPGLIKPPSPAGEPAVSGARPAWSDGWADGAPIGIPAKAVAVDRLLYRRLACPRCNARSNTVRPQHRKHAYRLLLICKCGFEHIA
jgi:hypothetical protein